MIDCPSPRACIRQTAVPRARRRRSGFTLIEVIAVAAIIAMIVGIGLPQLGRSSYDNLNEEAENIAQSLRFARQRAVMTGVPHRLLIDLEEGGYRVEWFVDEARAFGQTDDSGGGLLGALQGGFDGAGDPTGRVIDFAPKRHAEREYHPVPHKEMGSFRWLDEALYFVGVEGTTGWVESGDYALVFFEDGTTEPALVEIANADDKHVTLILEPVLERVHARAGTARP